MDTGDIMIGLTVAVVGLIIIVYQIARCTLDDKCGCPFRHRSDPEGDPHENH